MKKIEGGNRKAPREGGRFIEYSLWADSGGYLCVQMLENTDAGTFSRHIFRVIDVQRHRPNSGSLVGWDPNTKKKVEVSDNNNLGFLRAVLKHLFLDEGDE